MRDSYCLHGALESWAGALRAEAAGPAYERPMGMYGWVLHAEIHRPPAGRQLLWPAAEYDFTFDWRFDGADKPSGGEFVIFNLADETIRSIAPGDLLIVHGGFDEGNGQFIHGVVTGVDTVWKGPDKAVTLTVCENGAGMNHVNSRSWYDKRNLAPGTAVALAPDGGGYVLKSYGPGVRASLILNDLIVTSGLPTLELTAEADRVYPAGAVVEGPLYQNICAYAGVCGCEAYLVNGLLVVKNPQADHRSLALLLNEHTGLLGAPAPFAETADGRVRTGYRVTSLGNPRIQMGAPVRLQSRLVDRRFTVLRGRHSFDGISFQTEATLIE